MKSYDPANPGYLCFATARREFLAGRDTPRAFQSVSPCRRYQNGTRANAIA